MDTDLPFAAKVREIRFVDKLLPEHVSQYAAIRARLGERADLDKIVAECCNLCESGTAEDAIAALELIARIGRESPQALGAKHNMEVAVPVLIRCLKHQDARVTIAALRGLAAVGEQAGVSAVDHVTDCISASEAEVRDAAIEALRAFGQDLTSAAVEELMSFLTGSPHKDVRLSVCGVLEWLEDDGCPAIKVLLQLSSGDEDEEVAMAAARALIAIDPGGLRIAERAAELSEAQTKSLVTLLQEIGSPARAVRHRIQNRNENSPGHSAGQANNATNEEKWTQWKRITVWAKQLTLRPETIKKYIDDGIMGQVRLPPNRQRGREARFLLEDLCKLKDLRKKDAGNNGEITGK